MSNLKWVPVYGYEGLYEVSNFGEVRSVDRIILHRNSLMSIKGKILKPIKISRYQYHMVNLSKNGRNKISYVHNIVLESFVSIRPNGMVCCHNDGKHTNNNVENLRWGTHKENSSDTIKHGTQIRGERVFFTKLKICEVSLIKHLINNKIKFSKMAKMFKINKNTVFSIKNNKTWKYVEAIK